MNEKIRAFFTKQNKFDFSRQMDLHMIYFACNTFNQLTYSKYSFKEKYMVRKKILKSQHLKYAMYRFKLPRVPLKFHIILLLMKWRAAFTLSIIGEMK